MKDRNESLFDVCERVFGTLAGEGKKYGESPARVRDLKNKLTSYFLECKFVPSTPILTNAGRYPDRPLSACAIPVFNNSMTKKELEELVSKYHKKGMGTGFNFDDSTDPVNDLLFFNEIAVREAQNEGIDRPVGNMGILSINHPKIIEFITRKAEDRKNNWKFNLAVNITKDFIEKLLQKLPFELRDGNKTDPQQILDLITKCAFECGDPGVIFLDKFEQHNVTPHLGAYSSIAPCGEIAMARGEACQFGYINISEFYKKGRIDYMGLKRTIDILVKMLDNALDLSIRNFENSASTEIVSKKRKIGVGICGFQSLLWKMRIPYNSERAVILAEDIMSYINYESKKISVQLAKERGAFPAYYDKSTRNDLILDRYMRNTNRRVMYEEWRHLKNQMDKFGIRNVTTTSLPPTGRSSLVIGTSPSIEPAFRLNNEREFIELLIDHIKEEGYEGLCSQIMDAVTTRGSISNLDLPTEIKEIYKTCLEIPPESQLKIVQAFQRFTDGSISKTINLPSYATSEDIQQIYLLAYNLGLKGITVYRDKCRLYQPEKLKSK